MTPRSALLPVPALEVEPDPEPARPSSDEQALIARLASGDPAALGALSAEYRMRIHRFVRCYARLDPELCDDIAQQVLVEVARTAKDFEGRSRLTTWLFGVARNLCRTQLRRREDAIGPDARVWRTLPDPGRDPHELFERSEAKRAVQRALESLPAPYRAVIILREWEELPYEQIALVLGVPVGTVRSRLHSARALLAERVLQLLGGKP
jgi:RNA polymerase sigma-70 factor (ECF subfamily)